eukprot:TRINITY_DN5804_c0_g1_i1.p1 TRINITY_DN5804_c0_g1~~TRINITY_DN5804_c0_g1_i1.p1  ORF type:complete len:159 (-),score=49.90 TRINITY_DN5804_c0_g1_i1:507-983(-)
MGDKGDVRENENRERKVEAREDALAEVDGEGEKTLSEVGKGATVPSTWRGGSLTGRNRGFVLAESVNPGSNLVDVIERREKRLARKDMLRAGKNLIPLTLAVGLVCWVFYKICAIQQSAFERNPVLHRIALQPDRVEERQRMRIERGKWKQEKMLWQR